MNCAGCGAWLKSRHEVANELRALLATFEEPGIGGEVSRVFVEESLEQLLPDLECPLCVSRTEADHA